MEASLYRKYRPSDFSELIGQDIITKALTNQIKSGKISHAYLFTGSRGTGKTSTARIFAKALNCESPVNGNPCGKCQQCLGAGASLDIIEMDAASNNGVESIRDLRDDVVYLPSTGKYKIYIIDEVHMLSASAYNALLKTLEEPPAHVIFVLCTTNPEKISATILSRCMRFDFRLVSNSELEKHLEKIFRLENVKAEPDAVKHIAKLGEGSVRDTLSVADRCMTTGELTLENVLEITGTGRTDDCEVLLNAAYSSDTATIIRKTEELASRGKAIPSLSNDLACFSRDLMLIKATGENTANLSKDSYEKMKSLADSIPFGFLLSVVKELGKADAEIRYSLSPKTVLECALLSLCNISDGVPAPVPAKREANAMVKKSESDVMSCVGKVRKALEEANLLRLNGILMNLKAEDFELTSESLIINTDEYYTALTEEFNAREIKRILGADGLGLIVNKKEQKREEGMNLDDIKDLGLPVQEISGRRKK